MKTKTINVYQYNELSDKAKDKARQWYLNGCDDRQWVWDNTKEDAANIGLSLEGTHHDTVRGDFQVSALDCAERILKEHGEACETYKTANKYVEALRVKPQDGLEDAYEDIEHEFLLDLCEDYRIILNKEYEYQQSEEYIGETMEANEYEFTEDGWIL